MKRLRLLACGVAAICTLGVCALAACVTAEDTPTGDDTQTDNETAEPVEGTNVGDICPSFETPVYYGIDEDYYTPEYSRGKVTVINFWGTWCDPCLKEMPYLIELAENYGDDVDVVAIHSSYTYKNIPNYIVEQGWDDTGVIFTLDFVTAGESNVIYDLLGGTGTFPYTLILDSEGIIQYKLSGPFSSYNELLEQILPLI